MNDVITKLLDLQELDSRILALRAKLEEGPKSLDREKRSLSEHQAKLEEANRRAKEAMRLAERKNGELEEVDRKMKDLGLKLNTARSNKEYEALKMEIAGHRADFELLEEEALQQWSIGEDREKEADAIQGRIEDTEKTLEAKAKEWEEEAQSLEHEFESLAGVRAEKAKIIPMGWMDIYERVVENRGTPAVVEVIDRYCQGCQINVTVHDVTRAIRGAEIVQCKSCGRILYAETL